MKWSDISGLDKQRAATFGRILGVTGIVSGLVTLFSNEPRPTGHWAPKRKD
jgi:hypothetical protein